MINPWTCAQVNVPITVDPNAYTAGDVIGGLLSCDVPQIKGGGYIAWARLVDDGDQSAKSYYLHCFSAQPSTIADDAAFAPTEADKLKRFTTLKIDSANTLQDGADASTAASGQDYKVSEYLMFPPLDNGKMYFYLEDINASAPGNAADFTLDVCFMLL